MGQSSFKHVSGRCHQRAALPAGAVVMNPLAANLDHLAHDPSAKAPTHVRQIRRIHSMLETDPNTIIPDLSKMPSTSRSSMDTAAYVASLPPSMTQPGSRVSLLPPKEDDEEDENGRKKRDYRVNELTIGDQNRNPLIPYQSAVLFSELPPYFQRLVDDENVDVEYKNAIKGAVLGSKGQARRPANATRNRYTDISPYDDNRVRLEKMDNDYINASFIDGFSRRNEYIAAQGPLPQTSEHFWRMVWEQGSRQIVMMTPLIEQGKVKCHQYWPDLKQEEEYNFITITCAKEEPLDSFAVIRTLLVQNTLTGEERDIKQYHFVGWPDHGVPRDPREFLEYWRRVRIDRQFPLNTGPIVVHCSAGVGRTGVFVLCDIAIDSILSTKFLDVPYILTQLREQRDHLVQVAPQYNFCYQSLVIVCQILMADDSCQPRDRELLSMLRTRLQELNGEPEPAKPTHDEYIDVVTRGESFSVPNSAPPSQPSIFTLPEPEILLPPRPIITEEARRDDDLSSISSITSVTHSVMSAIPPTGGSSVSLRGMPLLISHTRLSPEKPVIKASPPQAAPIVAPVQETSFNNNAGEYEPESMPSSPIDTTGRDYITGVRRLSRQLSARGDPMRFVSKEILDEKLALDNEIVDTNQVVWEPTHDSAPAKTSIQNAHAQSTLDAPTPASLMSPVVLSPVHPVDEKETEEQQAAAAEARRRELEIRTNALGDRAVRPALNKAMLPTYEESITDDDFIPMLLARLVPTQINTAPAYAPPAPTWVHEPEESLEETRL